MIFEVQFRRNGTASAVFVTLSTGYKVLDDAARVALRQRRGWKIGPRVAMVPITFASGREKEPAHKQR